VTGRGKGFIGLVLVASAGLVAIVAFIRSGHETVQSSPALHAPDPLPATPAERRQRTEEDMLDLKSALDDQFRNQPVDMFTVGRYLDVTREAPGQ
jgi:hypothetical protein